MLLSVAEAVTEDTDDGNSLLQIAQSTVPSRQQLPSAFKQWCRECTRKLFKSGDTRNGDQKTKIRCLACTRRYCCLGSLVVDDAVIFVCITEFVQTCLIAFLATNRSLVDDFLYRTSLDAFRLTFTSIVLSYVLISVTVICCTLVGHLSNKPKLLIVHIVWQISLILLLMSASIVAWHWQSGNTNRNHNTGHTAVILGAVLATIALLQIWWLIVMLEAYMLRTRHGEPLTMEQVDPDCIVTVC